MFQGVLALRRAALDPRAKDLERSSRMQHTYEVLWGVLGKVTGASVIDAATYRWLYTWEEILVGSTSAYSPTAKTGGISGNAISMSELGNTSTVYAYGVPVADLPASFHPKVIPTNTPVWVVPSRRTDGTLLWLIVNTQAISGACP